MMIAITMVKHSVSCQCQSRSIQPVCHLGFVPLFGTILLPLVAEIRL